MGEGQCTFCAIVEGRIAANLRYEDDDFVVFDNQLYWAPVMLLLVPRRHISQAELWSDETLISKMGSLAARLGQEHCPRGFRILSNFGRRRRASDRVPRTSACHRRRPAGPVRRPPRALVLVGLPHRKQSPFLPRGKVRMGGNCQAF